MKGMQEAVEIIYQGVINRKPIVVYGDYDVDGVTATAVLVRFMAELGVECLSCHPDRFKHGYGLKAEVVMGLLPTSPGIVITVDCGISDFNEVEHLIENGWQVIVTDHHQPPELLPKAHALLNPWQDGCNFPNKDMAGVGVSFYLTMGLRNYFQLKGYWTTVLPAPNLKKNLDLVAVGTVSDMVPLLGINRLLTKAGLEVLANSENIGLNELLSLCNISKGRRLTPEDISFQIGPRLNAAGRMGDAKRASSLLFAKDIQIARQLAEGIEKENIERRELTIRLVAEALNLVEEQEIINQPCLIIHGREWHLGLLGILSSRLVDLFSRPVIVFGGAGILKGSARSIPGVNIHETIAACSEIIIEYGGHSSAAGLSLKEDMLPSFIALANETVRMQQGHIEDAKPDLNIDFVIKDTTAFSDLEAVYGLLAPFGQGNAEPVFSTDKPCRLRNMQVIGKEKNHLRFSAFLAGRWLDGVGFGFSHLIETAANGEATLRIAFAIKESHFNGQTKPQLILHDVAL